MFGKKREAESPQKQEIKLTRAQKKQLNALIAQVNRNKNGPHTAQQTIPYLRMHRDGICQLDDTHYSKTIQYYDINYQLLHHDEKVDILNGWGDFINFCDPTVHYQFNYITLQPDAVDTKYEVTFQPQQGRAERLAAQLKDYLQNLLDTGCNDENKINFVTFTVTAESLRAARIHLNQVEAGIKEHLRRLGSTHETLDGKERLRALHLLLHLNAKDQFLFEWPWLTASGLSTKDFIAPSSFDFSNSKIFKMGEKYATVSAMQIFASRLDDRLLADLMALDNSMIVTMHLQAYDQAEAIKTVKRKLSDIDRIKIDEQMKASKSGYDIDILPNDLNTYGKAASEMLELLQSKDQRMFMLTFLILNTADTKARLKSVVEQVKGITQPKECPVISLDFQQEDGLVSSLPLGINKIEIQRMMTTSSVSVLVPFTTMELFHKTPGALYYGRNALSHHVIMLDRKNSKNANGIFLGVPGSGKSVTAKAEMTYVLLKTRDDVIICDPEGEYFPLVDEMDGQVIRIAPNSKDFINPLDINLDTYSKDDDPLAMKSDFVLSMCELIIGGHDGLEAVQKSVIDHALKKIYQPFFDDPSPDNIPILGDLYQALRDMRTDRADYVADALEIYVTGSLNLFNHRTNVDIDNRLICYDIKDLGTQLKRLGMLIVQEQVWSRLASNREQGKFTWYYMDEFHLLLKEPQTASYSIQIWKRFRKWGGVPTALTQNIKDLTEHKGTDNILDNTNFICMLSQSPGDRKALAEHLNLSPHQLSRVTNVDPGEGLIFYENAIVPFENHIPKELDLYKLITTKPDEMQRKKE